MNSDQRNTRVPTHPSSIAGSGVELAADSHGDPRDPPVMFLHGAGQTRRAWDEAARSVAAAGWHAITVDHRGHGDSEWPTEPDYDFVHFADDVTAIVSSLDRRPVVVGASLGGMAALIAQGRAHQQLYRGLVLVDVTPRLQLSGARRILGFMSAHPEGFASLEEASAVIARFTGRPPPDSPEGLRQVLRQRDDGRWYWHWDLRFLEGRREQILDADADPTRAEQMHDALLAAARRVRVPTLVVRGMQSELVTPEAVREFVDTVPSARYVDVAGAGHMVAGDQNDRFVDAVVEFLASLPLPQHDP